MLLYLDMKDQPDRHQQKVQKLASVIYHLHMCDEWIKNYISYIIIINSPLVFSVFKCLKSQIKTFLSVF